MMLYVDGFRGFSKSYLVLGEVNFFVGENSTGKTSILKLLRIIQSPLFNYTKELEDKYSDLGSFSELVDNKNKFTVAIMINGNLECYEFKCSDKGMAKLSRFCYQYEQFRITVSFGPKKMTVKKFNSSQYSAIDNEEKYFKHWLLANSNKDQQVVNSYLLDVGSVYEMPLLFLKTFCYKRFDSVQRNIKIINRSFPFLLSYVGPIRQEPRKIYECKNQFDITHGENAHFILKKIYTETKRDNNSYTKYQEILNKFGRDSGLYDSIEIKNYLKKDQNSPFEIVITKNGRSRKISNVGYGVSQIIPVIISMICNQDKNCQIFIEQPEVHLHPKARSSFGSLLYSISSESQRIFFIETHSNFIIDSFRYKFSKNKRKGKKSLKVHFFENMKSGNKVTSMSIGVNGSYPLNQPRKFRDFFIKESLKLLEL